MESIQKGSIYRLLSSVVVVWVAVFGGTSLASNDLIREMALPEALSSAQSITVDAGGRVWFSEKIGNKLAVLDPKNNKFDLVIDILYTRIRLIQVRLIEHG